ncbi:MAG: transglutaminase domain-containing protein, partial [Oscillospiraceae bacterium]|nr:transglutaminase domain-containing protein [Oscillospiraceae bacterium]
DALSAAAGPGTLTPDAVMEMTQDGFLWFDGYLYRPDENGYFLTDQVYDSLYFDANGRYTCGNEELDGYVARTILEYTSAENTRLDNLHALYFHVKNDFEYLRRNFYYSGATGWDIEEALTIFRTNKGNCYCYAGAFCALARGMGYNAVTYSGTIGIQEQQHAWTEITLDDQIYICDPEIEMNYWVWLKEYTNNFMMRREKSAGWNYIAIGRTVEYE